MSDADMSKEVVRFIVYYDRGVNLPPTHLILGHGYGEIGRDHRTLHKIYGKQVDAKDGQHIYAGYFEIVGQRVHIPQGGSGTLAIADDDVLNRSLRKVIHQVTFLEHFIITQFPLVVGNRVPHMMFAI